LVASALAATDDHALAIRAGADLHPIIHTMSRQAADEYSRIMLPLIDQAAADRHIDRVIANQATAGRRRTDRAIAYLAATYHAALHRLLTAQRETIFAAANRERIDQATTTADQERINQQEAFRADRKSINKAITKQAAADQGRIDQVMAIQAAADRERVDQAIAIQAAADQTIAENAEVCLISLQALSKSSLSTVSFS
jgi:hypothetical protein